MHKSRIAAYSVITFGLLKLSAQQPVWLNHYGNGSSLNDILRITTDGASSLYAATEFASYPLEIDGQTYTAIGDQDILIAKLDTAGHVIWVRTAGTDCFPSDREGASGVTFDINAQHLLIHGKLNCPQTIFGEHAVNGSGGENPDDGFIAVYDSSGTCLWAKAINGFDVQPTKTLADAVSDVFLFGTAVTMGASFQGPPTVNIPTGGVVAKYDLDGTLLSAERALTSGQIHDAVWYAPGEWVLSGTADPGAELYATSIGSTTVAGGGWLARCDSQAELIGCCRSTPAAPLPSDACR